MTLDKIALGQYVPADSFIHALDPRTKIILTLVLMTSIFLTRGLPGFFIWGVMLFFFSRLSKIPFRVVWTSARPVLVLVVFTALLHLFLTPGEPLITAGWITVTEEGIRRAAEMSFRLLFLVMFASFLTLTTTPSKISDGLEGLLSPLKAIGFPSHEIAMMITIALRFIPTIFEETGRIIKAQKSRGADFEAGGLYKRAKAYIPVLIPLFVIIFKRAESLAAAMEARGYHGGRGRTRMYPLKYASRDVAAFMFILLAAALTIYIDRRLPL